MSRSCSTRPPITALHSSHTVVVPAHTPQPIVDLLNRQIVAIVHDPEFQKLLVGDGFIPIGSWLARVSLAGVGEWIKGLGKAPAADLAESAAEIDAGRKLASIAACPASCYGGGASKPGTRKATSSLSISRAGQGRLATSSWFPTCPTLATTDR